MASTTSATSRWAAARGEDWISARMLERVGFMIRFSSVLPWAVAMSWTPRSAMVRAAAASRSVPISSMMMTSGMWFSTASIITWCWSAGDAAGEPDDAPLPVADAGDAVERALYAGAVIGGELADA